MADAYLSSLPPYYNKNHSYWQYEERVASHKGVWYRFGPSLTCADVRLDVCAGGVGPLVAVCGAVVDAGNVPHRVVAFAQDHVAIVAVARVGGLVPVGNDQSGHRGRDGERPRSPRKVPAVTVPARP